VKDVFGRRNHLKSNPNDLSLLEKIMEIKVLGTGCANCKATVALIDQVAKAKGVSVRLEKVEELRDIMGYGVMSTPGVVIDGKVVHAGGVPSRDKIEQWLVGA
jgi:small redox-active disulfide protein 2